MVVFSLLVIVISGVLLAVGIVSGDDMLVVGSIVLSLIAAVVLFIGVWRQRDAEPDPDNLQRIDDEVSEHETEAASERTLLLGPDAPTTPVRPAPVRSESPLTGRDGFDSTQRDSTGFDSTDADQSPFRQESLPLSKKEHADWARSAVAAIEEGAPDEHAAIMSDRRKNSVDVATEIPQLMSASSTPRKPPTSPEVGPATAPQPPRQQPDTPRADAVAATGSVPVEPTAQIESPPAAAAPQTPPPTADVDAPAWVAESSDAAILEPAELDGAVLDEPTPPPADTAQPPPPQAAEQSTTDGVADSAADDSDDAYADPPDEPPAELLLSYEERQLAELDVEVLVVDGRPRFHLEGCLHLEGKTGEPLVLSEAAELGFTSCSLCAAATTVLAARS